VRAVRDFKRAHVLSDIDAGQVEGEGRDAVLLVSVGR
jgi:hypothetical protein